MVEWSRDYYIDPATTGLNAFYQSSEGDDTEDVSLAPPAEMRPGRAGSVNARYQSSESSELLSRWLMNDLLNVIHNS